MEGKQWSGSEESDETDEESPRKLILNDERRCKYCVKLLKNVSEVVKHERKCRAAVKNTADIVTTKDGQSRFVCNICFRTFNYLTWLSKHKLRHEPPGGFTCRFCDAMYCSDHELQKHKELTHMAYKCQICKGKYDSKESYEQHIMNVHDGRDRIYEICEDCGGQFKNRTILSFHKKSMCGTLKLFKCDQCGSHFQNQWSLKNHMLIHKGEKKFCCSFCGTSFLKKAQLVVHERKHTQEKPFVCDICSKAFAYRESLVTHSSIHTGIKPYLCEACGACFSCIGNLHKHRRNRPNSCGLPQYKSNAKVAPRPSFKSGRFTTKTKIPKAVMVLADDIKKVENNSEVVEKVKLKRRSRQNYQSKNGKDSKLESNIEKTTASTPSEMQQDSGECNQDAANQIDNDDKELVFILKPNEASEASQKIQTYMVEILQGNEGSDDDDDGCDNLDSGNAENSESENSEIEIKKEEDQAEFDIEISEIKTENDDYNSQIKSFYENKVAKENKIGKLSKQVEQKREDDDDDEEDNIPLSEIKLKATLQQTKNCLQEKQKTQVKSSGKRKKKEKRKTTKANATKPAQSIVEKDTEKRSRKAPRRQRNNLSAIRTDQAYECDQCPKISETQQNFKPSTDTKDIEIAKPILKKRPAQSRRRNNLRAIKTGQVYECDQCPKIYHQRRAYVKHVVNDHQMNLIEVEKSLDENEPNAEVLMRCKYCAKIYYQTAALEKHEGLHGPKGELLHKCPCCQSYFASTEAANKHAIQDHADVLTCDICQKVYSHPEGLNDHRRKKHQRKVELKIEKKTLNVCQKCGKKFVNITALVDHERSDCGQNPLYKCNICEKRYHSAGSLKHHQSLHTGDYRFKCSYCFKSFRTYPQVKDHERQHTGEKPYKCEVCNKAFPYRASLITHSSLHTGVKRFACHGCGTRFSCISNLQNHRRTHKDTCGVLPLNSKASNQMGVVRGVLHFGNREDN